jgi:uncharacterized protein HemX
MSDEMHSDDRDGEGGMLIVIVAVLLLLVIGGGGAFVALRQRTVARDAEMRAVEAERAAREAAGQEPAKVP